MKAYRISIAMLSVLVVVLGFLAVSGHKKAEPAVVEMWHTNTLEMWHTNTVQMWRTNTLEVARTTKLIEPITNEVIKEVPAKLTSLQKRAAKLGYQYINAPVLDDDIQPLYKASPLAVDVYADEGVCGMLGESPDTLSKKVEDALTAQSIPLSEKAPYRLGLKVSAAWRTDVPSVVLVVSRLELTETVAVKRRNDLVQCKASVWSTSASKLARTANVPELLRTCLQKPIEKFCADYQKAKEKEKEVESRVPKIPVDFLAESGP